MLWPIHIAGCFPPTKFLATINVGEKQNWNDDLLAGLWYPVVMFPPAEEYLDEAQLETRKQPYEINQVYNM